MGNCLKKKRRRNIVLLLIGLDNAGKTVTVKGLAGENQEDSIPTVGFSTISLKYLDTHVTIYDLGGGEGIRGIWPTYFVDAHGVIFVIDSSDFNRLDEAKTVLQSVLSHEKISGKPVLLLANKQDSDDALDELDLAEKLELEKLVNEQKCPTLIESCSAQSKSKKIDPGIKNGYQWILNTILREFDSLNERVMQDIYEQKIITQEKRKNIIRVNTLFENDMGEVNSDPFKPIGDVVKINNKKEKRVKIERNGSATSNKSYLVTKKRLKITRPKSAVDIVKRQLVKSKRRNTIFILPSNKTTPVNLFTPKKENHKNVISTITFNPILDKTNFNIHQNGISLNVTELPNSNTPKSISDAIYVTRNQQNSAVSDASSEKHLHQNGDSVMKFSDAPIYSSEKNIRQNGVLKISGLSNSSKTVIDAVNFHEKIQQNGEVKLSELPNSTKMVTVLPNSTSVIVETHVDLFAVNNFKPLVKNVPFREENWLEKSTKRKNFQEDLDVILKDVS